MAAITQFGTSILSAAEDATPAGASPGTVSIPAIPLDKTVISSADGTQTSTTVYENFSIASLDEVSDDIPRASLILIPVSYTHLTLPTKA